MPQEFVLARELSAEHSMSRPWMVWQTNDRQYKCNVVLQTSFQQKVMNRQHNSIELSPLYVNRK